MSAVDLERMAHAQLFRGSCAETCFARVQAMARELLCLGRDAERCSCSGCRLEDLAQHPDAVVLEPSGAAGQIGVDAARDAMTTLALTPAVSPRRVLLIRDVDRLHLAAANALLKFLEEPPANVYILASTARFTRVLPTICSRCVPVVVRVVPGGDGAGSPTASASAQGQSAEWAETVSERLGVLAGQMLAGNAVDLLQAFDHAVKAANPTPKKKPTQALRRAVALALADELTRRLRQGLISPPCTATTLSALEQHLVCIEAAVADLDLNISPNLVLRCLAQELASVDRP